MKNTSNVTSNTPLPVKNSLNWNKKSKDHNFTPNHQTGTKLEHELYHCNRKLRSIAKYLEIH